MNLKHFVEKHLLITVISRKPDGPDATSLAEEKIKKQKTLHSEK